MNQVGKLVKSSCRAEEFVVNLSSWKRNSLTNSAQWKSRGWYWPWELYTVNLRKCSEIN